jgi:hypothetical protein
MWDNMDNTNNTNNTFVKAKDLDKSWYESMSLVLVSRCKKVMNNYDKSIEDKYLEGLRYGVDEDGNHINLIKLSLKQPIQILNDMRNINNHRSRLTNIISHLPSIDFFTPFDEVNVGAN